MVPKFIEILFWICLLPFVVAAMALGFCIFGGLAILYLCLGLILFSCMVGASLLGQLFYGAMGLDVVTSLFTSDFFSAGFQLCLVPGAWWLDNFNRALAEQQAENLY